MKALTLAFGNRAIMISRLACTLATFLVLSGLGAAPGDAQGTRPSGPPPRPVITQPIDNSRLASLAGQVRPEANAGNDRGTLPDTTPLPHLLLQLKRPPEQEQALQQAIDQLHDASSADFHHWLSAVEFGARFGLATQDIETVTGWLEQQGFQVNAVYPNATVIDFSATAGQIRTAFHTELHRLQVGSESHFANFSAPQIPAALSEVVSGVVGLNDFTPHRQYRPRVSYTASNGEHLLVPADLATIYNLNPLLSSGISGQGQTIAVIEDTNVFSTSDWATFRSTFGLASYASGSFTQIHPLPPSGGNNCTNPGTNGDEGEAILDAEWASAAAPSAAIEIASCSNAPDGLLIAIQNLVNSATPPPIISVSYGECEAQNTDTASYNAVYQQAVAEGISVFVASGDWGAAVCDAANALPRAATQGIGVNALASSPYAVAVGGTDFEDVYNGSSGSYWNSSNTATDGSARSYVPEIPWNDSCASTLLASYVSGNSVTYGTSGFCNSSRASSFGLLNIIGGSGGPSRVFAKPSWQSGVLGNPSDGMRDLPDVSLFAGNGIWGHYYVFCWSDPAQARNGAASCTGAPSNWSGAGGTSFAAPILAGIQALVNQKNGGAQGNPAPVYYALAKGEYGAGGNASCNASAAGGPAASCTFYDVTQGNDDVPCTGANNCYLPSGTYGVLSTANGTYAPAFTAANGWDFTSGIGTINAANLVNGWKVQLTVTVSGSGTVTSASGGISCGNGSTSCSANVVAGQQVTLSAAPVVGSNFVGWSGACSGTGSCTVTLNAATSVTATFSGTSYPLSVTLNGNGSVTSSPAGINCGSGSTSCSANFPAGQQVTLTSVAANGWGPLGWTGACAGSLNTCFITMSGPQPVTENFGTMLTVSFNGGGSIQGPVPAGFSGSSILCDQNHNSCSDIYPVGQQVTLTATPSAGWMLYGWSGACSGTGTCQLTIGTQPAAASALFVQIGPQGGPAYNVWSYSCTDTSFDDLNGALAGTVPWSTTTSASAQSNGNIGQPGAGDVVEIVNTCLGDVVVGISNLTLTNHDDTSPAGPDTIIGQVELAGVAGVTLRNLILEGPPSGGFAAGVSNFTGAETALVYLHDGASTQIVEAFIRPGPVDGIAVSANSSATVQSTLILPNGTAYASSSANGITVADGSSAVLGQSDDKFGDSIYANNGYGVAVYRNSSAEIFATTLSDNQRGQVYSGLSSTVHLAGNQIAQAEVSSNALQAVGNSTLILDAVGDTYGNTVNAYSGSALIAMNHSSAILRNAALSSSGATAAAIQMSGTSSLVLTGGNTVMNSATGGTALQLDHTSSAIQTPGGQLGYPSTLAESFNGSALLDMQSSLDIGLGFLPGTTTPSFTWSVPAGNCILARANSALRISGGVSFAGAPPSSCAVNDGAVSSTIVIGDESNIFLNLGEGGTDTIGGGGSITCPFTGVPDAHVAGAKNISPNVAPTGSWSAAATASSPACLGP